MGKVIQIVNGVKKGIVDQSPLLLTSTAIAGVVSTAVLAVMATPKSVKTIQKLADDMEREYQLGGPEPLVITKWDIVRITWKNYIPAAATGVVTVLCIAGAHSINSRRNAALVGLYTLTDNAFRQYREKVVEEVGFNKERKVHDAVIQDRIDARPLGNEVVLLGTGSVLCYDVNSDRYFNSDMESIRKAENDINRQCINEMYASLNDFYRAVGIPITGLGEETGWSTDYPLEIRFSTALATDSRPCITLDYRLAPIRGYGNLH